MRTPEEVEDDVDRREVLAESNVDELYQVLQLPYIFSLSSSRMM